ncbi:Rrp15p-domain-containing protein [Byssothecium circinans]|uniref:Rrp15p-domain-containing protein n=1 Tax=Byssothecium circinans TaxID=147558 RepID=A0A6A5T943_9PLEO|nr:Rrp15p-domain-containing protein [Byssothecium circinans]
MPSTTLKRRRTEEGMRGKVLKKRKNVKRQKFYHSSSEEESGDEGIARDAPRKVKPVDAEEETLEEKLERKNPSKPEPKFKARIATKKSPPPAPVKEDDGGDDAAAGADEPESGSGEDEGDDADSDDSDVSSMSETSTNTPARKVRKRNDPEAFATSISKILNTKLTTQKRSEPILSRSQAAQHTNKTLADHRLTQKANKQLLAEKKAAQEKGRVKDVLGLSDPSVSTAEATAKEKELRRTAQKGVIKLFNAVRAAQVKGEAAEREAREKGLVGMSKREEKVKEMSKQGFLDMISGGTKKKEGSVEA